MTVSVIVSTARAVTLLLGHVFVVMVTWVPRADKCVLRVSMVTTAQRSVIV